MIDFAGNQIDAKHVEEIRVRRDILTIRVQVRGVGHNQTYDSWDGLLLDLLLLTADIYRDRL